MFRRSLHASVKRSVVLSSPLLPCRSFFISLLHFSFLLSFPVVWFYAYYSRISLFYRSLIVFLVCDSSSVSLSPSLSLPPTSPCPPSYPSITSSSLLISLHLLLTLTHHPPHSSSSSPSTPPPFDSLPPSRATETRQKMYHDEAVIWRWGFLLKMS